ncbi:sugar ABC transporter substrate-binding protein [Pseudogemmobacter sonorensis]|uniref:sugar ABC transporter substrate-binding protein n=1 Tax=Pseudogemmobacter sonorensis TaxID=2989681 RepID=UPI0036CD8A43
MTRSMTALAMLFALAPMAATAQEDGLRIAFLAASSQNGYNDATWRGVQAAAAELGNVDVEIFDGQFSATVQFSQVEDIIASGRFDGIVIAPNDTVGIATVLEDAVAADILVASVLFPVGPELTNMEPQVPGLTVTVAQNPETGAIAQAEAVADFCADLDPCNVVVFMGQKIFPFDNLRNEAQMSVLGQHANIRVVATGEGNYSPDTALISMTDILQANPQVHAVLGSADQHLIGIEIALEDAGIEVEPVYLIGGGFNQITVDAIREGRFDATLSQNPYTEGYLAAKSLVDVSRGGESPTWIDPSASISNPLIVTKEWLDANTDFTAEWEG